MITINMLDGEKLPVHADTVLVGYDNATVLSPKTYYLKKSYEGNLQGDFEEKGSALSTTDERLGISGFLLSHDMFSLGDSPTATLYLTSAVKSISVI